MTLNRFTSIGEIICPFSIEKGDDARKRVGSLSNHAHFRGLGSSYNGTGRVKTTRERRESWQTAMVSAISGRNARWRTKGKQGNLIPARADYGYEFFTHRSSLSSWPLEKFKICSMYFNQLKGGFNLTLSSQTLCIKKLIFFYCDYITIGYTLDNLGVTMENGINPCKHALFVDEKSPHEQYVLLNDYDNYEPQPATVEETRSSCASKNFCESSPLRTNNETGMRNAKNDMTNYWLWMQITTNDYLMTICNPWRDSVCCNPHWLMILQNFWMYFQPKSRSLEHLSVGWPCKKKNQ